LNKGIVLAELGKHRKAVEHDNGLKIDHDNVKVWNNKCISLTKFGKYEKALERYD